MEYVTPSNVVPSEETLLTGGYFLIMSRYPNQDGKFGVLASLSFQILKEYGSQHSDTPIGHIMTKLVANDQIVSHNDISDICVQMFDASALRFLANCAHTVGFETVSGDIIFQHST